MVVKDVREARYIERGNIGIIKDVIFSSKLCFFIIYFERDKSFH